MQIDKDIYNDINEYCKLNGLKTKDFIHKILKEGFLKEKYGDSPFYFTSLNNKEKELESTKVSFEENIKKEVVENKIDNISLEVENISNDTNIGNANNDEISITPIVCETKDDNKGDIINNTNESFTEITTNPSIQVKRKRKLR